MSESRTMRVVILALGTVSVGITTFLGMKSEIADLHVPLAITVGLIVANAALMYLINQLPALGKEKEGG